MRTGALGGTERQIAFENDETHGTRHQSCLSKGLNEKMYTSMQVSGLQIQINR